MTNTVQSDAEQIAGPTVGYTTEDNPFGLTARTMNETGRLTWNPVVEWTDGGFASTSADIAQWGQTLFTGVAMETDYLDRLLEGVPVDPNAPVNFYGSGVAIYENTPNGPAYGHGGWIPGYVSSLMYCADYGLTIAFQINSDFGVVDDNTDLVPALVAALAALLTEAAAS